jgi:ATP-dependent Clp protease protease subunit
LPEKRTHEAPTAALTDSVRERLFRARTLLLAGEIDHELAAHVIAQLLALAAEGDAPITLIVSSPGGHVESGDTIHDMVRFIRPRVRMIGSGWVASAAALVYIAAPLEDRYCLPNTRFLLHQPWGGAGGSASDMEIEAREILHMRERINRLFAERTGQPLERIQSDTRRNFWLHAEAAREYGLVGKVVRHADEVE